jgi:DNA-nicking Smr family endonuclease
MAKKKKNNKYEQIAERELDLHGYTTIEADSMLREFLEDALESRCTVVRIITGKGRHSHDGVPVIKNFVINFLTHNGYHFRYAKLQHGGDGAIDVLL